MHCSIQWNTKPEKASTHKSSKTHAGNVFVTRNIDLWPFDPRIYRTHGGTFLCQVWSS